MSVQISAMCFLVGYIKGIKMYKPDNYMILGNHVTVSCLVSAVSMDGAMNIRWKINGRWVKPLLNSRIQTTELNRDSYDPSLYTSNLIINGIKKVDTGIKINTKPVQVKPLPIKHLIDRVI